MNSMIDVREIKVGNYLQRKSNGNLCPVTPCIILDIENGKGGDYIPVPLNGKVLLSFGFEEYNEDIPFIRYGYRSDRFRIIVDFYGDSLILRVSDINTREYIISKSVCYLHQLQNIVFDLCEGDLLKGTI